MKSVGEVMAIGRTFKEALQKGIRSLEPSTPWRAPADTPVSLLREKIATPRPDRIHWLFVALERGMFGEGNLSLTKIDPWFMRAARGNDRDESPAGGGHHRNGTGPSCCAKPSASARATSNWRRSGRPLRPRCAIAAPRLTLRRSSSASIPAPPNSSPSLRTFTRRTRTRTRRSPATAQNRHSRQRAESHRAGN